MIAHISPFLEVVLWAVVGILFGDYLWRMTHE